MTTEKMNSIFASLMEAENAFAFAPITVDETAAVDEIAAVDETAAAVAATIDVKPLDEKEAKWLLGAVLNKDGKLVMRVWDDWDDKGRGQNWKPTYCIAKRGKTPWEFTVFRVGRVFAERLLASGDAVLADLEDIKSGRVVTSTVYKF